MVHVVVGIILKNNQVLIALRPPHKPYPGLWEFPGGKVEQGETPFQALQREFQEELNLNIITAEAWLKFPHVYSDRTVLLDTWLITEFSGEPHGAENQIIRWVPIQELQHYQFPEGNKKILEELKSS